MSGFVSYQFCFHIQSLAIFATAYYYYTTLSVVEGKIRFEIIGHLIYVHMQIMTSSTIVNRNSYYFCQQSNAIYRMNSYTLTTTYKKNVSV